MLLVLLCSFGCKFETVLLSGNSTQDVRHALATTQAHGYRTTRGRAGRFKQDWPGCAWGKTLRTQQRKKANKAYRKLKPYDGPKSFGGLCTMDHWFASSELSRGLYGESACVTFANGVRTILPVSEPMTRALSRQLFDTLRSELQELGEDRIGKVGNPTWRKK